MTPRRGNEPFDLKLDALTAAEDWVDEHLAVGYRIREAATLVPCPPSRLRDLAASGLLGDIPKTTGGHKIFTREHIERARIVIANHFSSSSGRRSRR